MTKVVSVFSTHLVRSTSIHRTATMMDSTLQSVISPNDDEEGQPLLPKNPKANCCSRDVIASLIACIGSLMMGLVLGYSSPALNNVDFVDILKTDENKLWFGSLVAIGALFGGPLGGILRTKFGLKLALIFCNFPLGLGWFFILNGQHVALILIGRILTGLGIGMISLAVPLYVAEVSEKSRRGILGCCFQLTVTIGVLLSYVLGTVLRWNYLALTCLIISLIYTLLLLLVPESPRWCISNKLSKEALESLQWLYNCDQRAEIELAFLESSILNQEASSGGMMRFSDLKLPEIYKPILIGVGLMVFQQMSGINAVLFYLAPIFSRAGFEGNIALPTIIVGLILVLATAIACALIDRLGRRVLLFTSGISMTISLIVFGVYYYLVDVSKVTTNLSWLSLTSVSAFICAFSLGWSSIPWLAGAEIIHPRAKSFGLSVTTITNWLFAFLTTKEIDDATRLITNYGTMWFFATCCILGCVFVAACLPETKGRSLEEIQKHFERR